MEDPEPPARLGKPDFDEIDPRSRPIDPRPGPSSLGRWPEGGIELDLPSDRPEPRETFRVAARARPPPEESTSRRAIVVKAIGEGLGKHPPARTRWGARASGLHLDDDESVARSRDEIRFPAPRAEASCQNPPTPTSQVAGGDLLAELA
jgi:hypothetical protein